MRALPLVVWLLAACGGTTVAPDAPVDAPLLPTSNAAREIVDTRLAFDVTALTGAATITFGPSSDPGATLEVGDLAIDSVKLAGADLAFTAATARLDLALPASDQTIAVDVAYHYKIHESQGASTGGYTLIWPYYCGNLFPCHSRPDDGTTFTLDITGVPAGKTAVFPPSIPAEAPSYQLAWSIDDYAELALGTTTAGTQVSIWHHGPELAAAQQGGAHLVAAFDWLEQTLGPYRFGNKVGTVSVKWPAGAFGGMEHHPRWHVAAAALRDEETNVHEAAHGWFGDGIRIQCWEDFVLSEGTVSYLAGRALEVVAPDVGAAVWDSYATRLTSFGGTAKVWPRSCGAIDILDDDLFTTAPYMRGAFFYRALALKVGADKVDQVLATFYAAHAGKAATMDDMLATIQSVTGYDPTACAATWLTSTTRPVPGPCP
ncbi:MAG: metallopeptidase [Deltaproteobacteria bacterium]|nr:metallopeptidase [Deltaproteobacteria bacterium]